MKKKFTAFLLAIIMVAQVFTPGIALAVKDSQNYLKADSNLKVDNNLKEVAKISADNYPKLTNKVILDIQKEATQDSRKNIKEKTGAVPFNTPYLPGQNIPDGDKPKIVGKVSAEFKTNGLDGGTFDWEGVFGKDSNGNPGKAKLVFQQWLNNKETDVFYELEVNKDGTYSWKDWQGQPARIPLYSKGLEPYTYSVYLDQDVSEKVKLLTYRIAGTPGSAGFEKDPETGLNVANIVIDLSIQQVASTKFVSEWHTGLEENARPPVEGEFNNKIEEDPGYFPFSKEDGGYIIIRNDFINNSDYVDPGYSEFGSSSLVKTPEVKVTEGLEFADENDEEGSPTYIFDEANKTITTLDNKHKFKYDFTYDVINGGKLTMTEVIPVTFDANGGKFASITDQNAKQEIVKEVEYEKDLTEKAENPTKDRETFKGWSETKGGTTPVTDDAFKNITAAKTFYAIWDNNDIQAEELEVKESFKDGTRYVNDFIPTLDTLKGKVKIKDAKGEPQALADTDTFTIVDGETEYTTEESLKDYLYGKLQEKDGGNKPSRIETVTAKVTHKNGTSQTVEIPIKVMKNIYEAKTEEGKPVYVPDGYVKVTVDPTTKAKKPQKYFYYVNPAAKVVIPGTDPTGTDGNVFTKWLIKGTTDEYKLAAKPRHMFAAETTIEAQYEKEKQGIIKIVYVDENRNEIDKKYEITGYNYPSEKSGALGKEASDGDFAKKGTDFKGYIFSGRDAIKGKHYKDPADPDKLDTVTYSYFKKVTTDDKSQSFVHFKVVFDSNGGEFNTEPKNQKDVYVYFAGDSTPETVTFAEVREAVKEAYGKPSKTNENFIEWQDKAADGAKVADDYVIKVPDWDWTTYPDDGYTPEVFYAHYGKASALISYLDLDGKPIADTFKIDTEKYPEEKEGTAGENIAKNVFTAETAPKFIGYKFNRIELNPKDGKYALDKKATIKIYYEKLPDVIPEKDGSGNQNEKPDGYVEVKFVPTDNAEDKTEKIFYVNPKRDVTIPIANPEAKATYTFKEWKMGAKADGAVYTPSTAQRFTEITTVITATYEETENIIPYDPSVPDPMVRPEGYARVTFAADAGLKLTESKAYYVKKNVGIKLGNADLVKPAYKEETGYKFKEWDKKDDLVIEAADIVVTAKATKLDSVIPEKDKNDKPNEKPEGYKEVTFVIKSDDKDKGSITGVAKFYVNPTEYVTINPPATKAETGYKFGSWDKDATIPTVYDKDTTITGSFNGLKDIIPKTKDDDSEKPAGYVTVTFELEELDGKEAGKIVDKEITVYYVKPNTDVTVPQPKVLANIGYEFKEWTPDTSKNAQYSENTTVKGSFKKLDDIIPSTDENGKPNAKPEGYVTVTFDKGGHGKEIIGQTAYYVNPKADPAKTLGDTTIVKPEVKAETGYKFTSWNFADTKEILSDLTVIAQYKKLDDVIPKTKEDDSEKPDGYIEVTFSTETNGKIKDTTDTKTKVVYVNPNKAVTLKGFDPEVTPNTGYDFADWDTSINKAIQYKDKDIIKALYNEKDDVIPQEKTDGSDKAAGYLTVTFDKGANGELIGKTVYYVKPNKEVTVPAPDVKPSVGYEFDKWDKALTQTFTDENTTITAKYKKLGDIIPQDKADGSDKPDGYYTVTFKTVNGTTSGQTIFYVNGEKEIDLTNTANGISKKANIGYTDEDVSWSPAITNKKYTDDAEYTFTFKALPDVIEEKAGQTKPDAYVKVEFIADVNGELVGGNKTYYVNPEKNITVGSDALPIPTPTPDKDYKFDKWYEAIDKTESIKNDKKFVARFILNKVTMTYKAEDKTSGDVPEALSYDIGTEITLAGGVNLKKDNYVLVAWSIGDKSYLPGAKYTITEDTVATAVWEADTHTVEFDTDGAEHIPSQQVKHNELITPVINPQKDGYFFIGWKIKGTDKDFDPTKDKVTEDITLVAQYTQDVIPQDGPNKPDTVPSNFVEVKFVPTDKAKDTDEKIFWVNPDKEVTIPVENPVAIDAYMFKEWKLGVKADGDSYDPKNSKQFEEATTITATYTKSDDIIPFDPKADDPMVRPEGYVKVTFDADLGLKLSDSKAYYVKKNAGITLKTIKEASVYGYPKYKEASGYDFDKWDKPDTTAIGEEDIVVTAKAKQDSSPDKPDKPGDGPGYGPSYPEVVYRDRVVEKEKIVEKIVHVDDGMNKEIRYMQGFDGFFRPYDGLSRAEAAQILANALREDGYVYNPNFVLPYSDVGDMWYTEAVKVVTEAGVFKGDGNGLFKPTDKITRAEWIATLRRFQNLQEANGNTMNLKAGHWATNEVQAAYEAGWLDIYQNGIAKFASDEPITRQEVAAVSNKAFRRVLDKIYIDRNYKGLINYKDIDSSMALYEDILCASNTFLHDGRRYRAHGVLYKEIKFDHKTIFNIDTDDLKISQDKFQYILRW